MPGNVTVKLRDFVFQTFVVPLFFCWRAFGLLSIVIRYHYFHRYYYCDVVAIVVCVVLVKPLTLILAKTRGVTGSAVFLFSNESAAVMASDLKF